MSPDDQPLHGEGGEAAEEHGKSRGRGLGEGLEAASAPSSDGGARDANVEPDDERCTFIERRASSDERVAGHVERFTLSDDVYGGVQAFLPRSTDFAEQNLA